MTNARPSMPAYARDWLTDTEVTSMTPTARAAYWDLICTSWINDGIPAPNGSADAWRGLAAMARVSIKEIKKAWPSIEPHFIKGADGRLRNKRGEQIRQELDGHANARSEAGREGAKARWQTHGKRMANA